MSLARLVRRQKKTSSAKELIEKAMRQAVGETAAMDTDDWIRISSMGSLCPREEVIRSKFGIAKKQGIDPDLGFTFEAGHAVHWMMQNKVMSATGRIAGSWRCTWCGEVYGSLKEGVIPRPAGCMRCGAIAGEGKRINNRPDLSSMDECFVFAEEWIGNFDYMIGGTPDGYFIDGDPLNFTRDDLIILEFKSASDVSYTKFEKAADFTHVIQCQCYMWLSGLKRAKIIYVNKGKFGMAGIAEHDITYDPETIVMVKAAIKAIRAGLNGGPLPERVACSSPSCPRSNACEVSKQCFAE